jgi:hypothetical protein
VLHDIFELVKALAWPCVTVYIVVKFGSGITSLLNELPPLVRRVRSAHGLGIEIELDRLSEELPLAEQQAQALTLEPVPEPKKQGVEQNG